MIEPPKLTGGVVQQTYWDVTTSPSEILVGVPGGWSDENVGTWDASGWRRIPAHPPNWLGIWIGRAGQPAISSGQDGGRTGLNSSMFGRTGDAIRMDLAVVPRRWLLGGCSGLALLVGVAVLSSRRRPGRAALAAVLVSILGVAAFAETSTLIVIAQSSAIGLGLTGIAALLQRAVDARGLAGHRADSQGPWSTSTELAAAEAGTPAADSFAFVGSDDPTSIRSRPGKDAAVPMGSTRTDPRRARPASPDEGA